MKKCCTCSQKKSLEEFPFIKKKQEYSGKCKECVREYHRKWHHAHPQRKKRIQERIQNIKEDNIRKVFDFLKENPCIDCGESNPVVLQFDHEKEKVDTISNLISLAINGEKLKKKLKNVKSDVQIAIKKRRQKTLDTIKFE